MKKLWIVGLALLAVAAIVLLLCLNQPGTQSNEGTEPAAAPATQPPSEPPTEPPTEPPAEAPTEPPLEPGETVIFDGTEVQTVLLEGQTYVPVQAIPETGLTPSLSREEGEYVTLEAAIQALSCAEYVDAENGRRYFTPGAARFESSAAVNVPVLMYHAVSDDMWGIQELFVSPSDMEAQLQYLTENGYEPIWFSDLAHVEDYEKPVLLTFDDGYDDNYTELYPLLKKYNVKATIFVIANAMGTQHKMTEEQVRELADSGLVSIQSHGLTHDDMDWMDEETLVQELGESQRILTRVTGRQPYVLCYPTGKYSDLTLEVAERYYNFGLKMVGGQYCTSDDPFLVNRYYVSRYTGLDSFAAMVSLAGTEA